MTKKWTQYIAIEWKHQRGCQKIADSRPMRRLSSVALTGCEGFDKGRDARGIMDAMKATSA